MTQQTVLLSQGRHHIMYPQRSTFRLIPVIVPALHESPHMLYFMQTNLPNFPVNVEIIQNEAKIIIMKLFCDYTSHSFSICRLESKLTTSNFF